MKKYTGHTLFCLAAMCLYGTAAAAPRKMVSAELTLPSNALDRNGIVPVSMHFEHAHTGTGTLHVHWSDSLDRVVTDATMPITLTDEIEFSFTIDLSRAVAMKNQVDAELTMQETTPKGAVAVDEKASVEFFAKPRTDGWKDYQIIMYQNYPSAIQSKLETLGINGGQWVGRNMQPPEALVDNNMRWYSENIATDFYSEYHRWRSDRPVNASFVKAKELYQKDPTSKEAFKRHPSFWDPAWRTMIHDRMIDVVKRNDPFKPFFYSLSDESGIADLGAQWDFDFSDQSLVPMRVWLQKRYGTLSALNAEWGTAFSSWDQVYPFTTNEAMQRKGENFAPWADFKEWMDISYANALRMGVDAAHEVDPNAFVGIVGAQKPGWGGYDYTRLTEAVNVMEPYDIGSSVKLAHSLNPAIPLLSTTFASGDWERHRIWFELLQGNRGLILWDEGANYIRPDGTKGTAGAKAEGYYRELREGMGALIINSTGLDDGIAIHYSQPSMRTEWMLERRPDGDAWWNRDAKYERTHNDFLRLRESWGHLIEDQGLQYNFVSYMGLEKGELQRHGYRVLILPRSSSLSQKETENIRSFISEGGVVVADGLPGTFDEHSRRLPASPLADLFSEPSNGAMKITPFGKGKAITLKADTMNYLQNRITGHEGATYAAIADLVRTCGLHPEIAATDEAGKPEVGTIVRTFTNGAVRLLSVQSNPQQRVDELGPADFRSNDRFAKKKSVRLVLPKPMYVYDTRRMKSLGRQEKLAIEVDPYDPTILALSENPLPMLEVKVPEHVKAGETTQILLATPQTPAATQIYNVEVLNASGDRMLHYSQNVVASGGSAVMDLPLAKNDTTGKWTIHVRDMLSGAVVTRTMDVQ